MEEIEMLINKIIEEDTKNCHEAMERDAELLELEKQFYRMIQGNWELENIFTAYMARVTRIAYLQGIKDFAEMCGILNANTQEILRKYVDR